MLFVLSCVVLLGVTVAQEEKPMCPEAKFIVDRLWNAGWQGHFEIPLNHTVFDWRFSIELQSPFTHTNFHKGWARGLAGMTKINVKAKSEDKKQLKNAIFTPGMVLNFDRFNSVPALPSRIVYKACTWNGCKACMIDPTPHEEGTETIDE